MTFDEINDLFADVDGLICDSFQVPREQNLSECICDVFRSLENAAKHFIAE